MEKRAVIFLVGILICLVACSNSEPITKFASVNGKVLGSDNATVKVYEFTDYACPYCKKAESVVYDLVKKYGNKIRLEHKQFVVHPNAYTAAEASECAADQNKFWEYNKILFDNQVDFSTVDLNNYAKDAGLDVTRFSLCLMTHANRVRIEKDMNDAKKYGYTDGPENEFGTPTFVINDQVLPGLRDLDEMSNIIDKELENGTK